MAETTLDQLQRAKVALCVAVVSEVVVVVAEIVVVAVKVTAGSCEFRRSCSRNNLCTSANAKASRQPDI